MRTTVIYAFVILGAGMGVVVADAPVQKPKKSNARIVAGEFISFKENSLTILLPTEPPRTRTIRIPQETTVLVTRRFGDKAKSLKSPNGFKGILKGASVDLVYTRDGSLNRVQITNDPERSGDSPPNQ